MRSYVAVKFLSGGNLYTYLADGSVEELKQYNYAVVESPNSGYTLVTVIGVTELDESTYNGKYKHVVHMFSDKGYTDRLDKEKRKRALEKELRQRIEQQSLISTFETVLASDEEGRKLLEEYKSL